MESCTIENILGSDMGRKAVETTFVYRSDRPAAANLFRDLLEEIERLGRIQLPEFTEHGLPHIESLARRIDTWTCNDGSRLLDGLTPDEAFLLFFATLTHDIGMLSQREDDLQPEDRVRYTRMFADIPAWVRRTHVHRIEGILHRILICNYPSFVESVVFSLACSLARSHNSWPDETDNEFPLLEQLSNQAGLDAARVKALAAVLAVADLLDEDSSRCDTITLLAHKAGNLMNRAHWLRHLLTDGILRIDMGEIRVKVIVPTYLFGRIPQALIGLSNHYHLSESYNDALSVLGAQVTVVISEPCSSSGSEPDLHSLRLLLCQPDVHLLRTLDQRALPSARTGAPAGSIETTKTGVRLTRVDRSQLDAALGSMHDRSPRSDYEITYLAAKHQGEEARAKAAAILGEIAWDAHQRGDIILVHQLTSIVLNDLEREIRKKPFDVPQTLDIALWAATLRVHWATSRGDMNQIEQCFNWPGYSEALVHQANWIEPVPELWHALVLTITIMLNPSSFSPSVILDAMQSRANQRRSLTVEEALGWHDLIETIWGLGLLSKLPAIFDECFSELRQRQYDGPGQPLLPLSELAWRMSVQSYCLAGYGEWEQYSGPRERGAWELPTDKGVERIARFWETWFHSQNGSAPGMKGAFAAVFSRGANPKDSQYYLAGLEAMAVAIDSGTAVGDEDDIHRFSEMRTASLGDSAYAMLSDLTTQLLDSAVDPIEPNTVFFVEPGFGWDPNLLIAQRLALRWWALDSWQRVVGYHLESTLVRALQVKLQGRSVRDRVLFGLINIGWVGRHLRKSENLLRALLGREKLSTTELQTFEDYLGRSSHRIACSSHPGVRLLQEFEPAVHQQLLKKLPPHVEDE